MVCPHNVSVDCTGDKNCDKCGWNPKVDAERKKKTREKLLTEE